MDDNGIFTTYQLVISMSCQMPCSCSVKRSGRLLCLRPCRHRRHRRLRLPGPHGRGGTGRDLGRNFGYVWDMQGCKHEGWFIIFIEGIMGNLYERMGYNKYNEDINGLWWGFKSIYPLVIQRGKLENPQTRLNVSLQLGTSSMNEGLSSLPGLIW